MYHFRLKGDHYQMGVKRGKIFQRGNITFPLHLDAFQLEHGRKSEAILSAFFPEVCEEIRGVSDTIGTDYHYFAAWMLCMGCCMYNLADNIPVEVRGCTAFAYAENNDDSCNKIIYGRNNDLPPYLKKGSKSEIYAPIDGNCFQITTSSFINGEEGLNEHGLAVAMTFVMTPLANIQAGLNACFIVRYLLEKATHVDDAIRLLLALPVASNCNILLADKTGRMVVVECTSSVKRIREAIRVGAGSLVCTVNSFTSAEMRPYAADGNDYDSDKRYRVVTDHFAQRKTGDLVEQTQRLLRGEYGFMCQYDSEPDFETVWSSVFDLKSLMVYRAEGDPRKKNFLIDERLHRIVAKNR